MDPHPQVRIIGRVRRAIWGRAPDPPMNGSHNRDRALSIGHRAVGGQRHILASALEASPEIAPEASMINNSLQRYWMKRLQEQRSYGTDEHRRIGVYPPDRILFTEPTL